MKTSRKQQLLLLGAMTAFCAVLSIIRVIATGKIEFVFLNWNLFLAFIPLAFTTLMLMSKDLVDKRFIKFGVLGIWLLFFPNAPYILTDLIHLKAQHSAPIWFDLILILSYAWTGLLAGFISLYDVEKIVFKNKSIWLTMGTVGLLIFVTGFGIYLGRFLRFNSWDVFQNPGTIFTEVVDRFVHPLRHTRTWGMTLGMGVLLNFMYWSMRGSFKLASNKASVEARV